MGTTKPKMPIQIMELKITLRSHDLWEAYEYIIYTFRVQPVFVASYKDPLIRTHGRHILRTLYRDILLLPRRDLFLINTINFVSLFALDGEKISDKFEANI